MKRDGLLKTANGEASPRIGLGCMGMSEFYGASDDVQSLRALHLAYDLGYRHFDTADMYGQGHNERLLARFLRELGASRRDSVFVATKVGIRRIPGAAPTIETDSTPGYVERAFDESLRRLGVDRVDLLYLHRRSRGVPIEETVGAMGRLVRQGKAGAIGLSEVSAETLRRADTVFPVSALQSEYSLWTRDVEADVLGTCAELGVTFVAYSPLGRGFLGGKLTARDVASAGDIRQHLPRFTPENFAANERLLEALQDVATSLGVTPGQVALGWLLAQGPGVHAIPGARREEHLRENLAAAKLELPKERVAHLSSQFPPGAAAGARLPAQLMSSVNG